MLSNHTLEEQVMGLILFSPEVVPDLGLDPAYLTDINHQSILSTIQRMQDQGKPVDLLLLSTELAGKVSVSDLAELQSKAGQATYIQAYVDQLRWLYIHREVQRIGMEMKANAEADAPIEDMDTFLHHYEDQLYTLGEQGMTVTSDLIGTDIDATLQRIAIASRNRNPITGVPTGFKELDRKLLGLQPTDLIIIAARPSVGKTALAVSMVRQIEETPIAFFSLEMGREQILNRVLMQVSGLSGEKVRSGVMTNDEQLIISQAAEKVREIPLYVDDTPGLSISQLRTKARRLVRRNGVRAIFVDYLQLLTANLGKNANRENEVSAVSRGLKCLAKELHIPIVALSQLNREPEMASVPREPRLADLRESGAIEQDADIVIMLWEPRDAMNGERELKIAKNRNGATGSVLLKFDKPTAKFYEDTLSFS